MVESKLNPDRKDPVIKNDGGERPGIQQLSALTAMIGGAVFIAWVGIFDPNPIGSTVAGFIFGIGGGLLAATVRYLLRPTLRRHRRSNHHLSPGLRRGYLGATIFSLVAIATVVGVIGLLGPLQLHEAAGSIGAGYVILSAQQYLPSG